VKFEIFVYIDCLLNTLRSASWVRLEISDSQNLQKLLTTSSLGFLASSSSAEVVGRLELAFLVGV
jgi:hypothetical protein